jgi:hypothetical protein
MLLTPNLAAQIVSVVGNDAESKKAIPVSGDQKPSRYRGAWRNIKYMFSGKDKNDPEVAARICTGIAETTAKAIDAAVKAKKLPKMVLGAIETDERSSMGVMHTATRVGLKMDKGMRYVVFDWHSTLDLWNPLIYPTHESFLNDSGWVHYSMFNGFK